MSNIILERINQVLGNLLQSINISQNYIQKYDLWSGIFDAASFAIRSTNNT